MTIRRYRTGAAASAGDYRFGANRRLAALIFVLSFCLTNVLGTQRAGERDSKSLNVKSDESFERAGTPVKFEDGGPRQQRVSPLGIQVLPDRELQKQETEVASETENNGLQQIGFSYRPADESRSDIVADGTVTVQTATEPRTFGVTLIQNGEQGSQRILLQQADGKFWDGRPDHLTPGAGPALEFLDAQYRRAFQQLLKFRERGAIVTDKGIRDSFRIVTVQEQSGESTTYSLEPATSRVIRFEFVRSSSRGTDRKTDHVVHSYTFSDFHAVDGVAKPFHIEHLVNDVKQEELQLNKIRYSPAVPAVRSIEK
jgi:hypothetical protein